MVVQHGRSQRRTNGLTGHTLSVFGTRFSHLLSLDFSEQDALVAHRSSYDVLVIPGTTATTATAAAGSFTSVIDRPYVVDPRSWLFQLGLRGRDGIQAKYLQLAREHGGELAAIIENSALQPEHVRDPERLNQFVAAMLDFQSSFRNARQRRSMAKYLARMAEMGEETELSLEQPPPFVLVPPYFSCGTTLPIPQSDESCWFEANVAMAEMAAGRKGDIPLFPVVALSKRMLLQERARVVQAYGHPGLDGYFVLVDGMREDKADECILKALRDLVLDLSSRYRRPVMNLAGGFYSLLLYHFGLSGLCHAPGYGESRELTGKTAGSSPGRGGVKARYYLPKLHRFYPRDQGLLLLQLLGREFWCTCPDCNRAAARDEFMMTALTDDSLVSHYMSARSSEIEHVLSSNTAELSLELEEMEERARSVAQVTDPLDPTTEQISHLGRWARALRS